MKMLRFALSALTAITALSLSAAACAGPSSLNADPLTGLDMIGGTWVNPPLMRTLALGPRTWTFLIDTAAPQLSPYAESLRQLALKPAPLIKPVPSAPREQGPIVGNGYSQVIAFGDSLSDAGNLRKVTTELAGIGLPMAPNDEGRLSNGPVAVEVMSNALHVPLLNHAFAGAQSGQGSVLPFYAVQQGLLKQINDFLSNLGRPSNPADAKALYVLWIGADDYHRGSNIFLPSTSAKVTAHLQQAMNSLYQRGARNFFVPLMPDLSLTPSAREHNKHQRTYVDNARLRSSELAASVTAMLKAFARQHPQAKVRTFDTFAYSQQRVAQAAAEGRDVTVPCYTAAWMGWPGPVCRDPENHLFWDAYHPTEAASRVIGTAFANAAVGEPLPSR